MKAFTIDSKRVRRQHRDCNQRPDDGIIWMYELVIDPSRPEQAPMIKITRGSLWATIREGLFPEPAAWKGEMPGWELRGVRDWVSARDALNPATASPYDTPDKDLHVTESILMAPASSQIDRSPARLPIRLSPDPKSRPLRALTGTLPPRAYQDTDSRLVAAPGGLQ